MKKKNALFHIMGLIVLLSTMPSQATEAEVKALKQQLEELRRSVIDKQQELETLAKRLEAMEAKQTATVPALTTSEKPTETVTSATTKPEEHSEEAPLWSQRLGNGTTVELSDLELNSMFVMGCSTAKHGNLEKLHSGEDDPKRCGFTLQQVAFSMEGAIAPYFDAKAVFKANEEGVELDDAYLTSTHLPYGLQLKGGYFLTEFGHFTDNPHWIDQPIINNRFFGGGLRSTGAQLNWLLPIGWHSKLNVGAQNPSKDKGMVSFFAKEQGVGNSRTINRHVNNLSELLYSARWENSWHLNATTALKWGVSGLFGPNNTGKNTDTRIYGTDFVVKWQPAHTTKGFPFVLWETEFMQRSYDVAAYNPDTTTTILPANRLKDKGFYTQALYGFKPHWAAGMRYEYANGKGEVGNLAGHAEDALRSKRQRLSPLLIWYPADFSRVRLQYNYDKADFLNKDAHSLWLGVEFVFSKNPSHQF